MMEKYYSKVNNQLLHIIHRLDTEQADSRQEIVDNNNFIQCSYLTMQKGKTFKPHKHIIKERIYKEQIAQESWIVIKGRVKCIFYDIDDTVLATPILEVGDSSFTLYGGHNYEILEDGTIVYEYKTGPYEGQQHDKVFI